MIDMAEDARYKTKDYLDTNLTAANILKDDAASLAAFAVIFKNPPYPILKEFYADSTPANVLFCIGEPESRVLMDCFQVPYGYEEFVPVEIICVDKIGVTGTKLKWTAEKELRRACEANPTGSQWFVRRIGANDQDLGSTILYGTRFEISYRRDTT